MKRVQLRNVVSHLAVVPASCARFSAKGGQTLAELPHFVLALLLLWALPAVVQAQFNYTTANGTITITGYTGPGGAVTIPDRIDGLPVTRIGSEAFRDNSSLTSVTIPDSVTSIGNIAFASCANLTNVTIGNRVTSIGSSAFSSCSSLSSIKIPDGVTRIEPETFKGAGLTTVTIPNSVTSIGYEAFYDCGGLTSVIIGSSVTNIEIVAFYTFPPPYGSLKRVFFLGNAPNIVSGSFNLGTLYYLPGTTGWGPTYSGRPAVLWDPQIPYTFTTTNDVITITEYMGSDNEVTIPGTINALPVTSIGDNAFDSTRILVSVTNVTIPDSVTNIGSGAFFGCSSLTGVTIPNGVTRIGDSAFFGCTSLSSLTLGNSIVSIGDSAFNYCISLTSLTIPDSLTSIGDWAFTYGYSLTNLTLGSSVTSIGYAAFGGCFSLTGVTLPSSVTSVATDAFGGCTSLTGITIPNSVTNVGPAAFSGCSSLTAITVGAANPSYSSVDGVLFDKIQTALIEFPGGKGGGSYTVPNSVTSIEEQAFAGCSLTNIAMPNSVTNIGNLAFNSCTGLTSITIPSSVRSIWFGVFHLCRSLTSIAIPDSVTTIEDYAFYGCTSLGSVTIGNSVTNIGSGAFYDCGTLTGIYFRGNAPSFGQDVFSGQTLYYLPGTTGWVPIFGGVRTALWKPRVETSRASFGVRTNQFGFNIAWASGRGLVVEACTHLSNPIWSPLQTNTLSSDSFYFADPEWTNYPARFYRLRAL